MVAYPFGLEITDISKLCLHQANEKLDDGMTKGTFKLYGIKDIPTNIMPMTISWLANSSVATIPTLLDLIIRKHDRIKIHEFKPEDYVVSASVGAGMNIIAMAYKFPKQDPLLTKYLNLYRNHKNILIVV